MDDAYVLPLCVMLESLTAVYDCAENGTHVIVLYESLDPSQRRLIEFNAARLCIPLELRQISLPGSYPVSHYITKASYFRLAIPDVVTEAPTVLYLDVDLLILQDLAGLLACPLNGAALAAVHDTEHPTLGAGGALPGWEKLGLTAEREYFNAGVLLLDLVECRKQRVFERAHHFLHNNKKNIRYHDQDVLNWAASDNWLRLDYRWNTQTISTLIAKSNFYHPGRPTPSTAELVASEKMAAILHFAGRDKPWMPGFPPGWTYEVYNQFLRVTARYSGQASVMLSVLVGYSPAGSWPVTLAAGRGHLVDSRPVTIRKVA